MAINVITVSGRIGSDCDLRYTPNNKAIASFSIPAVTGWGDNKKTSWLSCKLFGERAEKLAQYLTKGTPVTITGSFQLDEWDDNGIKKSRPVILVNDVALQGDRSGAQNTNHAPQQQGQDFTASMQQRPANHPAQQAPNQYQQARNNPPQQQPYQGGDQFDDSIPF